MQPEAAQHEVRRTGCTHAAAIAVLDHRADVTLSLTPPSLTGQGEVRMRLLGPGSAVQLDTVGLRMLSASTDERPVHFTQQDDTTCFELTPREAAADELTLTLTWRTEHSSKGLTLDGDQAWAGHLTASWLPTRLDASQHATLTLTLTIPDDLEVATSYDSWRDLTWRNGDGLARLHPVLKAPTSPALYGFAVGRFRRANYYGPGFRLSALGPSDADLMQVLELTLPLYQLLCERLGSLPGYDHYTQAFVRSPIAQEGVRMSLISDDVLGDPSADLEPTGQWTIARMLALQWFGVLVPIAGVADLWLSEGFATFMVAVMKEARWGRVSYEREVASWRARLQNMQADSPLALSARRLESPVSVVQLKSKGVIAGRGALVLDRLRRELGDKVFWEAIRRYVAERAGRPTRTADLQGILAAVSGRDLDLFFDRYVYNAALPL